MPSAAALQLAVVSEGSGLALEVYAGTDTVASWRGSLSTRAIRDFLAVLPARLRGVHNAAGNQLDVDPERSAQAVDLLMDMFQELAYGLFRDYPGELWKAAKRAAPAGYSREAPPVIEVRTPEDFSYPFELLRWRDDDAAASPADRLHSLLGMAGLVRRHISGGGPEAAPDRIPNIPVLPMTVFRNPSLTGAQKEMDYLSELKDTSKLKDPLVHVYGPWPDAATPLAPRAAAMHMVNPSVGVNDGDDPGPVAVMHLACHCLSGDTDDDKILRVGGVYGDVTLADLKNRLATSAGSAASLPRPLVFLNACSSSPHEMPDHTSFTEFLMYHQHRGVLGTLYEISDTVAAHFAMVFYEWLLRGYSVGEAMYEARWHLMDRHRNPLGLLYTFHGNVDLKVELPFAGNMVHACTAALPGNSH
jgi:hypothetical protein